MRLGVMFSGGKDSTLALHLAAQKEEVACLITVVSKNKESYMFHTPNIDVTALQAEALGLPLVSVVTEGRKEEELADLEAAIAQAKSKFQIDGVVTGAVESVYQASRVQRICNRLDIWCFNPLWKHDQKALLETLVAKNFKVVISGIFAYPLDEKWLGKQIDAQVIARLVELQSQYGISPSGEGGEIETTVLDAPMFKQRIEILDYTVEAKGNCGVYIIKQARLVAK
ncbi:MAG: TIGR00289 family protein [Chloroflexi bacterium]|nr:TIGR00289 family protein [Chloroflexota bacterium]MCL5949597.1 TIGR00289 family protein [Candidatus Bathyarchaeota archaeon]